METAKLRILTETEPPKIIAQTTLEADVPAPSNDLVAVGTPIRPGRRLDVDGVLARSLRKVAESTGRAG